jgi:hypothetical protein
MRISAMATNSVARFFLVKKRILESMGVMEVPVSVMMEEAVEFMFPAVIQIMENRKATEGVVISCFMFRIASAYNLIIMQKQSWTSLQQTVCIRSSDLWAT